MSDITPATVISGFWRWFWVGVGGLVLLVLLIVGGWRLGWWFTAQNATRQNQLIQNGVSNQETLRAEITDKIGVVVGITAQLADPANKPMRGPLRAERMSAASLVCADAARITGVALTGQQATWVRVNCSAGNVKPSSPFFQAGVPGA